MPQHDYQAYAGEGYAQNSIVYACIRKIATTAPAAELVVRRKDGEIIETLPEHPIARMFARPNDFTSGFEFQELIYTFLNLIGECFIIRVPGEPGELYVVRPDRMFPIPSGRRLLGFVYRNDQGGIRVPFMPDEVIHIKYPNPLDEFEGLGRGLSPLSAAAFEADADIKASRYLRDFFQNAAIPFGLLKSKSVLDDLEIERIRARIKSQYSGERNWAEIMILDADAEYQKMGLTMQEITFPDLRRLTESRICSVFDVPPVLVGVQVGLQNQGAFVSNIAESRTVLWEDKIIPDNQRIAEILTFFFRNDLADKESVLYDYAGIQALRDDRDKAFERADRGFTNGWLSMNEARVEAGLDAVDGGNILVRNPKFNYVEVSS
ncbi:MAG: phage portal protein [bacterium]